MANIRIQGESDGSMSAEIPDFALDSTVAMLANATGVSNQILKQIAKASGVSQLELNKLSNAIKQQTVVTSKKTDDLKDATDKQTKAVIDGNAIASQTGRDIGSVYKAINSNTRTLEGVMTPIASGLNNLVTGLTSAIPGIGGLIKGVGQAGVAVTSFMAGSTDEFIKQTQALSKNIGLVSTGNNGLMDLRDAAARAGLFMSDLTAAAEQGGTAIALLADQSNGFRSGLIQFTKMSDKLAEMTKKFGDFGFSVAELNELMVDEMSLRRQRGASDDEIRDKTNASLTYLLRETTALADLTGRNRRDMIRGSMEVRSDVIGRQRLAGMSPEERQAAEASQQRIFAAIGPEIGAQIVNAANQADVLGRDIMQTLPQELQQAFQLSDGALRDITNAYLAGDQEALSTQLLPELLKSIQRNQETINQQAASGNAGANVLLEMQTQTQQSVDVLKNAEVRSQELANLAERMNIMLTPRELQRLASEMATMAQNVSFGDGGPEKFAEFVQKSITGIRGVTGVDQVGKKSLSPEQIAALGLFFANSAAVSGVPGTQPNDGGGASATSTGLAAAAGGLLGNSKAAKFAVGLAGNALRFIGPLGAFIFAGAAVAAIGKGIADMMSNKQAANTIREIGGPAIAEATDQLRSLLGDVFGTDIKMDNVIKETAVRLMEQGIDPMDLSQAALAQELVTAGVAGINAKDKSIITGGAGLDDNQINRALQYADALASGDRAKLGIGEGDLLKRALDVVDATDSSFADKTENFAKNAQLLASILDPANRGIFDAETRDRALKEVAVLQAQVQAVQAGAIEKTPEVQAMLDSVLPGLKTITDMVAIDHGIFSTDAGSGNFQGGGNQAFAESMAQMLQSVTLDSDAFASAGINDEKQQRMLLALENALENNVLGQIDNVDLAVSSAMTGSIRGTDISNLGQLNSDEVIKLLMKIANSAEISATSDVAIFESNRVKELRERSSEINN